MKRRWQRGIQSACAASDTDAQQTHSSELPRNHEAYSGKPTLLAILDSRHRIPVYVLNLDSQKLHEVSGAVCNLYAMFVQDALESPAPAQPEPDSPRPQTGIFDIPSNQGDTHIASPTTCGSPINAGPNATSQFHELPQEVLDDILNYLIHDVPKLLPFEQRASLSFESFASVPPIAQDTENIFNFRNVCRKFWGLGRSRIFTRVTIRSSQKSFNDIIWLSQKTEIAQEVKKLSYMVHDFYPQDEELWNQLLLETQTATADYLQRCSQIKPSPNITPAAIRRLEGDLERSKKNEALIREVMDRVEDQRQILENQIDETTLLALLTAFENLQQIRLMRNEDKLDRMWQNFLRTRPAPVRHRFQTSPWKFACERATMLLSRAYVASGCNAYRFSSRFMDPPSQWLLDAIVAAGSVQDPDAVTQTSGPSQRPDAAVEPNKPLPDSETPNLPNTPDNDRDTDAPDTESATPVADASMTPISSLSSCLICLELQIDDPYDLSEKMLNLSRVFQAIFSSATKMEGLHIGLRRPISVPLESIFHNVVWRNLSYIGFSRWNLPGDQIFRFIRRHKDSLRSVRFREVRLTEGKWIDIVKFLRLELKLNWVSFRQVGYDPRMGGGPVPETGYGGGFAMLRRLPEDDYEASSSDSSDDIGDHAGTGNDATRLAEEEEASSSENEEPEGPVHGDVVSDESVGADVDIYGTIPPEPIGVAQEMDDINSSANDGAEGRVVDNEDAVEAMVPDYNSPTVVESQAANFPDNDESVGSVLDDHHENLGGSPSRSDAGDSEVGRINEVALDDQTMVQHSSATDEPVHSCYCENGYAWEDVEDDKGLDPTKAQWKMWERWVVKRCPTHDPPQP